MANKRRCFRLRRQRPSRKILVRPASTKNSRGKYAPTEMARRSHMGESPMGPDPQSITEDSNRSSRDIIDSPNVEVSHMVAISQKDAIVRTDPPPPQVLQAQI